MLNIKEVEKWIRKNGKEGLTWEKDEKYNYIYSGSLGIMLPNAQAIKNEEYGMHLRFENSEVEKIIDCERLLNYYFLKPPAENETLRVAHKEIQFMVEIDLRKIFEPTETRHLFYTNLIEKTKKGMMCVMTNGNEYFYFNQDYMDLINEEELVYLTQDNNAYVEGDYTKICILRIEKKDKINKYLRKDIWLEREADE